MDDNTWEHVLDRIQAQVRAGNLRLTQHAQQEMVEEDISLEDLLETISQGHVQEDYPQHKRGPVACYLVSQQRDAPSMSFAPLLGLP